MRSLRFFSLYFSLSPKPRSKKRKRDDIVIADPPEIPVADPFGETTDFGNLQIPDLLSFPTINPDLDFLDTQNSLYQARVEDITMLEDNLNLASAQNLTFGEDFAPSAIELFQEHTVLPVETVQIVNEPSSTQVPTEDSCKVPVDVMSEVTERPTKRPRIEETEPTESVLVLPDANPTEAQQAQQLVEPELCQVVEQNAVATLLPPETVQEIPVVNQVMPEPYTVPLEELNQVLPNGRETVRRIRRGVRSKLVVDQELRLTVDQLRYNMEHGEETMVSLDSRLAEPASRLQTRYLLSNCVPRLLAVPANLETALSANLCELWCRYRRMGEKSSWNQMEPEVEVTHEVDPNSSRLPRSETRITEELMETSIEQQRGGQTTMSLHQSVSLLGGTGDIVMDVTVNQAGSQCQADSVASLITPAPERQASPPRGLVSESGIHRLSVSDNRPLTVDAAPAAPNPMETMTIQADMTTLYPLPDEREENRAVYQDLTNSVMVPETNAADYANSDEVWSALQTHLNTEPNGVYLDRICPTRSTRRVAALTFSTILQLLKKQRIRVTQSEPFGPIHIQLAA